MARTFQDRDFLMWEAFPSAGEHGFSERPWVVFNCLTDRMQRPRCLELEGDEADAEKRLVESSDAQLLSMLEQAQSVE